jgi:hypothetical protein
MRRLVLVLATIALVTLVATSAAAPTTTAYQLTTRFKQATGVKLVPNKRSSYTGHYKAYDLGAVTIASKARYGTFTVFLVTGGDVEADVTDLLADSHTGALGTPAAGGIHWESGTTISGERFWQAKKRYGQNVVLWWIGSTPVKKTDASFARLNKALVSATR